MPAGSCAVPLMVRVLTHTTKTVLIEIVRPEDLENLDTLKHTGQSLEPDAAALAAMSAAVFASLRDEGDDVSSASTDFPEFLTIPRNQAGNSSAAGPSKSRTKVFRGKRRANRKRGSFFEDVEADIIKPRRYHRLDGTASKPIIIASGDEGAVEDNDADMDI